MKPVIALLFLAVNHQPTYALEFDASVRAQEKRIIERDLDDLCRLNYNLDKSGTVYREFKYLFGRFGIEEPTCRQLKLWLEERIGVITRHLSDIPRSSAHWQPRFFPILIDHFLMQDHFYLKSQESQKKTIAALNLSTGAIQIRATVPHIPHDSPIYFLHTSEDGERSLIPAATKKSVVYLTDDFFIPHEGFDESSIINSITRIGILFHEARHSDALGADGGYRPIMEHVACPNGSFACDATFDKSHGIQFTLLAFAFYNCHSCGPRERYGFRLLANRRLARILSIPPEVRASLEKL